MLRKVISEDSGAVQGEVEEEGSESRMSVKKS